MPQNDGLPLSQIPSDSLRTGDLVLGLRPAHAGQPAKNVMLSVAELADQGNTVLVKNISDATPAAKQLLVSNFSKMLLLLDQFQVDGDGTYPDFTTAYGGDGKQGALSWLLENVSELLRQVATIVVPTAPDAPTQGQVDDQGDTFSFLPNPDYPAFSSYLVAGLPGVTGPVYLDGVNSYVQGARVYIKVVGTVAKGGLAVFIGGSGTMPAGKALLNSEAFTGTATPPAGDTLAPNVTLTTPAAGAVLTTGQQVTLAATATDNVNVSQVVFTNGATGQVLGTGAKNGNSYTLPYTPQAAGSLTITATASDAAGNSQGASVTVQVQSAVAGTDDTYTSTYDSQAKLSAAAALFSDVASLTSRLNSL